jgi:dipeptidyl aminopeptidase/acylaminoacyl peptidase
MRAQQQQGADTGAAGGSMALEKMLLNFWSAVAAAVVCALVPGPAASQARPAIEAFFQNAALSDARLSPDGRFIAIGMSAPGGRTRLVVMDAEKLTAKVVGSFTDADVATFDWINNDRLVFNLTDWQTGIGDRSYGPGLFAVPRDGGEFLTLVSRSRNQPTHLQGLSPGTGFFGTTRERNSDAVFVYNSKFDNKGNPEAITLARLDTNTRQAVPFSRPGNSVAWWLDAADTPRVTVTVEADVYAVMYLDPANGQWRKLVDYRVGSDDGFWPVGLDGDGTLYVRASKGDKQALYRYDLKANALDAEPLMSLAEFDLYPGLITRRGKVLGVRYQTDASATAWFDDNLKQVQQKVDALLPGTVNQLSIAGSGESPHVLVYAFSDVDAGKYFLYNTGTSKLTELGPRMRNIDPRQMASVQFIKYKARDGLLVPAYLTLPRGAPAKNLPLVVMVHDGPWLRGMAWHWNAAVQFLASRGYAVLQPEFRGGTGFGRAHFKAGWKQWGLAMQDDIADGARWAISQGIADGARICVAGEGYGGYATLMGLARDADLFRCGVSWMGTTDLDLMFSSNGDGNLTNFVRSYSLPLMIGDRERDAEQLKATSPLLQAARIKQPVLLAYGGADRLVPIVNGTRLRDAVQKHNSQVEWVEYTEEGHGWALLKNRVDFWGRVEKFLERNIGPK